MHSLRDGLYADMELNENNFISGILLKSSRRLRFLFIDFISGRY